MPHGKAKAPSNCSLVPDTASPIDKHIGSRSRLARQLVGMNQAALAKTLELTAQHPSRIDPNTARPRARWALSASAELRTQCKSCLGVAPK